MAEDTRVCAPAWNDADPYTHAARLCDDDGIVRRGPMHHGTDYTCTGHAHYGGDHIRCTSAGHPYGLPRKVVDSLTGLSDDEWRRLLGDEVYDRATAFKEQQ